MSSNFDFLRAEWPGLFAEAVLAEKEPFADPRICCFYARRTLELAVAWLYDADATLNRPYKDDLSARLYEPTFRVLVGNGIQIKCDIVRKQGNAAVHKTTPIPTNAAVDVLRELFHVLYWIAKHTMRKPGDLPASGIAFDTSLVRRPESASVRVTLLAERGLQGAISHKRLPAPIQATQRWPVERTHSWPKNFYLALPKPSSWSADSYAAPGSSTAGTHDHVADLDLLAHSLNPILPPNHGKRPLWVVCPFRVVLAARNTQGVSTRSPRPSIDAGMSVMSRRGPGQCEARHYSGHSTAGVYPVGRSLVGKS